MAPITRSKSIKADAMPTTIISSPSPTRTPTEASKMKESFEDMIVQAVKSLDEMKGSSGKTIKKFLSNNFGVKFTEATNLNLKRGMERALKNKKLERLTGRGLNGSFRLPKRKQKPSKDQASESQQEATATAMVKEQEEVNDKEIIFIEEKPKPTTRIGRGLGKLKVRFQNISREKNEGSEVDQISVRTQFISLVDSDSADEEKPGPSVEPAAPQLITLSESESDSETEDSDSEIGSEMRMSKTFTVLSESDDYESPSESESDELEAEEEKSKSESKFDYTSDEEANSICDSGVPEGESFATADESYAITDGVIVSINPVASTILSSSFYDLVSFAPTQPLLHCITKDRPKILHQRRPPTMKSQQLSKFPSSSLLTPDTATNESDPLV